jgi:hypothetical protein
VRGCATPAAGSERHVNVVARLLAFGKAHGVLRVVEQKGGEELERCPGAVARIVALEGVPQA